MNPLILIGDTFVLVGRQWRLIFRANWWVILFFLGALVGSSWLALRLLELVPSWMYVEYVQAIATGIVLLPEFLTLIATGVIAHRMRERLGGFGFGVGSPGQGRFMKRWILTSVLVFAGLAGIEIAHTRYLEFMAQYGDFEFQGIVFMVRHYANIAVFLIGLYFLVALQSRASTRAGATYSGPGWRAALAVLVAGLLLYMSVASTISQLFLFLPPFGFFWATLDRLQPPYFFLTELARTGSLLLAPIIYAGFILVAGEAVRRARAAA